MLEAAAAILVGPTGRLHDTVERHVVDHDDSAHLLPPCSVVETSRVEPADPLRVGEDVHLDDLPTPHSRFGLVMQPALVSGAAGAVAIRDGEPFSSGLH